MAKIPLLDVGAQLRGIRGEIESSFRKVLETGDFILGKEVFEFEKEFASYLDARRVVSCANGTDALLLILKAIGIRPGDRVITTSHTFVATIEAIIHAGGIPVLLDVDPETELLDPALLRQYLENHRSEANRGIIAVHLRGNPCRMYEIADLAAEHGLFIVEDAAQAHGATYDGKKTGTFGAASAFSFYPGKNLGALGDAGAVAVNDPKLEETIVRLRNHGRLSKHDHEMIGFNSRMDTLQAAMLRVKLGCLDEWNAGRKRVAAWYDANFEKTAGLRVPVVTEKGSHVYHHYAIRVGDRDRLAEELSKNGVSSGIHYPFPAHHYRPFRERAVIPYPLPVTEEACRTTLSLPIYPELSDGAVNLISDIVHAHPACRNR
jgi:dTDP-4-amino-4,6-dideoxygalactose transaminase